MIYLSIIRVFGGAGGVGNQGVPCAFYADSTRVRRVEGQRVWRRGMKVAGRRKGTMTGVGVEEG
jgi:hypothetical protein